MINARITISNFIEGLALGATFLPVTYTPDNVPQLGVTTSPPTACNSNETKSTFAVDKNYGRDRRLARDGWDFELNLQFAVEVSLDDFIESLKQIPFIPSGGALLKSQTIVLLDYEAIHPPKKGATNGTVVKFHFLAVEGRT